jgi:hypothetical protein
MIVAAATLSDVRAFCTLKTCSTSRKIQSVPQTLNPVILSPVSLNMGTHLKTTIELSDVLLDCAKQHARRVNTTLRALIEAGLNRILVEQAVQAAQPYELPDLSVGGGQILIEPANWRELESEALLASLAERHSEDLPK